jgi:hypothetical protein
VRAGQVQRREDQPVDEAVLQVSHHRDLVLDIRPRRVQQQPQPPRPRDLLDRADHRRVDGIADIGHGEGDLARTPRAQRARGGVRCVADPLGGFGHPGEGFRARANPVQNARRRGDRDIRQSGDRLDRRYSVVGLIRLVQAGSVKDY